MRSKKQKGIFFTLAVILLVIPLLLLLSFYFNLARTNLTKESEKMRCEELHYWVEDIKKDLGRAVVIFGRRAAIYSLGEVVDQGRGLENYTFNCTSSCGVNCTQFSYEENGAEAALTELVLCGTFKGGTVTYMENHTLNEWIKKIGEEGTKMHYNTSIILTDIKIIPRDAWNFAIVIDLEIKASDKGEMCFYQETPAKVMSITSIVGLEDPLYPLNTNSLVIKYIYNCSLELNLTKVVGSGSFGEGNGTGTVVLYSNLEGSLEERICGVPDKENKIIILDQAYGIINNPTIENCLNEFAGIIDYVDVGGDQNVTSSYIYGTGELNLNDSVCIGIRNTEYHEILQGTPLDELTDCYEVSNLDELGENCPEKYPEGGSFFDRLDGNYFLGDKYVNQSQEYFNTTKIGLESIIDIYELYYHAFPINKNATWVDYLYWQGINGTEIEGICNPYEYDFRLDCQHKDKYLGTTTTVTSTTTSTISSSTSTTTSTTISTTTSTISATTSTTTSTTSSSTTTSVSTTTSTTSTTTSTPTTTSTTSSSTSTIPSTTTIGW